MNGEKQLYNILKIFKIIRFFSHQSSNFGRRRRKRRKITFWKKKVFKMTLICKLNWSQRWAHILLAISSAYIHLDLSLI